tara:strand:- start:498 stop:743 length:246 start_codon:yes stop_codon:yes gene_type:complete
VLELQMNRKKQIVCSESTLRKLKRNRRELLNAESVILQAVAIDAMEGIQTDRQIIEKIFEVSDLILHLNKNIKKCEKKLRK